MAKWVSSSYVAASWVNPSWFGDITSFTPAGDWLAFGWFDKRYLARGYSLLDANDPGHFFTGDTLAAAIAESNALTVFLSRSDTLSISISESQSLSVQRRLTASDTLSISLAEARTPLVSVLKGDTVAVSFDETGSVGINLTFISSSDDLDLEVNEGDTDFVALETQDSVDSAISESDSILPILPKSDGLSVTLTETATVVKSGAFVVTSSDVLSVSFSEVSRRIQNLTKSSSDMLSVSLSEVNLLDQGSIIQYLQAADSLNITISETASPLVQTDTDTIVSSDVLSVGIDETSSKVDILFISTGDEISLVLVETKNISKSSVDPTWEDADYPWGGTTLRDLKPLPVMAKDFNFYQADMGPDFHGKSIEVVLERLGLTIYGRDRAGEWKEDPDVVKLVKGIWPIFRGQIGTVVKIRVGSQETPESPVEWDGPYDFVIGVDKFQDVVVSGPYIAVRFESVDQLPWQLLSYDLDITTVGRNR